MPISFDGKKGEFSECVTHFMSKNNTRTDKNFSKEEANKVCGSLQAKQEAKGYIFSDSISLKSDGQKWYLEGTVAAGNKDLVNDIVELSALRQLVDEWNTTPKSLGYWHTEMINGKPELVPIGTSVAGTWKIEEGKAIGKFLMNNNIPVWEEVKGSLNDGHLNSLSIEHKPIEFYFVETPEGTERHITKWATIGAGLTGRPINTDCLISDFYAKSLTFETKTEHEEMEECPECKKKISKDKMKEHKENHKKTQGEMKMEEKSIINAPQTEVEIKAVDFEKIGRETYEKQIKEAKIVEYKAIAMEAIKAEVKAIREKEPYINPAQKFFNMEQTPFDAELKGWKEAVQSKETSLHVKYQAAAKLHNALSRYGINNRASMSSGSNEWKKNNIEIGSGIAAQNFQMKAFEYKAQLEHDTNKISDTDYYQNAAELNDIYDPVILDHLNNKTTYYGLLRKKDVNNIGSDRYGFKIRTGRIAGAGGDTSTYNYDEAATLTGQNSTKLKVQAPFMQYGVVLQVSGLMQAEARGSIGDAFAKEVMLGTADLLKGMNVDLFGTAVGFTDGGKVTGLQVFGDDGGSYANLYGHARATYTTLQGNERAQTGSPNITKVLLRQIIRDCEVDGADRNNLIIVCHPIQRDKILGMLDPAQRFNNTSARAGFEGLPTFDAIPIHSDVDATNTIVHIVPMDKTYLAVLTPPTFEDLAKTDDSKKGFVKTYFAHVMEQPNHGGIITGLSNS